MATISSSTASSRSTASPSRCRSTSRSTASCPTRRSVTPGSASRPPARSTARTSASRSTRRSKAAAWPRPQGPDRTRGRGHPAQRLVSPAPPRSPRSVPATRDPGPSPRTRVAARPPVTGCDVDTYGTALVTGASRGIGRAARPGAPTARSHRDRPVAVAPDGSGAVADAPGRRCHLSTPTLEQ